MYFILSLKKLFSPGEIPGKKQLYSYMEEYIVNGMVFIFSFYLLPKVG